MTSAQTALVLQHIRRLAGQRRAAHLPDAQLLERFTTQGDGNAFAALVRQHGPMVLNVCRSVLRHEDDAEDAFQATFLVLVRKAASIRQPEAVAGWLYEVAYHVAVKAQAAALRRRAAERRVSAVAPRDPTLDMTLRDLQRMLHEELQRLPEKYRLPIVLCYLEGRSHEEAASQLGWSKGTLRGRLDRGREQLRRRLAARGMALSGLVCATAIAPQAVGKALVDSVVRSAALSAVDGAASSAVSARASALAEGVTQAMFTSKLKIATGMLLAIAFVAGAGALGRQALAGRENAGESRQSPSPSPKPEPAAPKAPRADEKGDHIEVSGHVVDPDGKPVTGAKLVFVYSSAEKAPEKVWATSASGGQFRFWVAKDIEESAWPGNPWDYTYVVAVAKGYGFAWARVRPERPGNLTLRLVKDDVPIRGRVLDLQGKPVAGATVRIDTTLHVAAKNDLGPWLEALKGNKPNQSRLDTSDLTSLYSSTFGTFFPPLVTGADGRFTIQGIGHDRVAELRIEGPTIATQEVKVITRSIERIRLPPPKEPPGEPTVTYQGASFDLVVMPTRPIVGVARDQDSGKPLPGVTVRSHRVAGVLDLNGLVRTTTDREGRYRLLGLPKGSRNAIIAETYGFQPQADDLPYFPSIREVGNTPGLEPIAIDLSLKRGIWVKGRVSDKATGKGVRAGFDYFSFPDNPHATELPLLGRWPLGWTDKDGQFRTVALPGRGLIAVVAYRQDKYPRGVGGERLKDRVDGGMQFNTLPYHLYPGNFHMIVEVSPKQSDESIPCDVVLDPGQTSKGKKTGK
jgi:RNA polymerase sigma factor (sigma-70 family)